jgi:tripartite-type tricarboxylate transporter receptor subunit TctC
MIMMRRIFRLSVLAFLGLMIVSVAVGSVFAQGFPTKPIRIIVPYVPGGPTDVFARIVAQKLSENLGQQVIIDNRGGGNAIIGTEMVAKAPPDGYTLLFNSTGPIVTPGLYKSLPFDVEKDFEPITLAVTSPNILAAHPSFSANTVKELIAMAKAKPDQLNCAISTLGSTNHLALELFKSMAGIKMETISYKGAAPALNALLGGHVPLMFNTIGLMVGHIKAGKLKALAVTSPKRTDIFPEVPAISETLSGFEAASWFAVWGPAGMQKEIVTRLNNEIAKALHSPDVKKRCKDLYAEAIGNSHEEFVSIEKSERAKWAKVIKDFGIILD